MTRRNFIFIGFPILESREDTREIDVTSDGLEISSHRLQKR